MKYQRIAAAFNRSIWAILPEKLAELRAVLERRLAGEEADPDAVKAAIAARRSGDGTQRSGAVAVLPVFGTICQRIGMMEAASGGISTEEIGAALDGLVADKTVACIIMLFDSGGGSVYGVDELARKIAAVRARKRIVAMVDSVLRQRRLLAGVTVQRNQRDARRPVRFHRRSGRA